MRRSILLALAVVVFARGLAVAGKPDGDRLPFINFLLAAGDKLDCYFIIEQMLRGRRSLLLRRSHGSR